MGVTAVTIFALALSLAADNRLMFIAGAQAPTTTGPHVPQTNRTSKELAADRARSMPDLDLKTTGRKLGLDDYNTFSSLTSDVVVETSSSNAKPYPSLTTSSPSFVTRGRFIKSPFYFGKDDQEVEFDDEQHAELMLNGGIPKWNRFNNNHRQLNKYGPAPIEADITVDEDGSTGYGSAFDFGGAGGGMTGYDTGSYRAPTGGWGAGGDSAMGWYNEPMSQPSRPVPIIAEIRHPNNYPSSKMSVDLTKIGMVALVKIAIAKLKALGFIKAMLLVLFKIKLLVLIIAVKSLMLAKFLKATMILPALFSFLTFPMFLTRLSRLYSLLNQPVLVPNSFGTGTSGLSTGGSSATQTPPDTDATRRSRLDPSEVPDPGMSVFRHIVRSEKCVERISCRMAGAENPSLTFVGMNWAMSPVSKYIPSKKIRTFVSTFTEVTNYRLDNLYSSLLPKNWKKWCDDHYSCEEAKNKL